MEKRIVFTLRALTVALGSVVPLADNALGELHHSVKLAFQIALWTLWAVTLLCVLVPSSTSLTALRIATAAHVTTSIAVAIASSFTTQISVGITISAAAFIVGLSAEIGNNFVQSSAYGDERRHLLKAPRPMAIAQAITFIVWYAATFAAITLLIDGKLIGIAPLALSALAAVTLPSRFHRYSRRWLVSVPAGLVIHDYVVLAETAMFKHPDVRSIDAAATSASQGPADLTGGFTTGGIVITLAEADTVVLAPRSPRDAGRPIHVTAVRVMPSRIGAALRSLTRGD